MIKVGITGQTGFVGQCLYNTLGLFPSEFCRVEFHRDFFKDEEKLLKFVNNCDVVVHLAALNRHADQKIIYETNISLVGKLNNAFKLSANKPHVIFSSSSQEDRDNEYGRSKKEGREIFIDSSRNGHIKFTGLVIPNVFGPFGHAYYNSFIATFCHQLTHNETPHIAVDSMVSLIFVADLAQIIIGQIRSCAESEYFEVRATDELKVTEVLNKLNYFKNKYFECGIIPELISRVELNLFNTFRSYIDISTHFPVKYTKHSDSRGTFVEIIRLSTGGQVSFSTTVPGITRGNHYHTRKIERFSVIKGKALIQLRKIGQNKVLEFILTGEEPAYVDMPVWYTHNIKNIGNEELFTNFWINEFYNSEDPDTYMEIV